MVGYCSSGTYNATTGAYYYDGSADPDHGVAVIGWDDDYAVENFSVGHRPPTPGAFLIKNSWGADSRNTTNGYNWVSYCDTQFAKTVSIGFFAPEATNNYSRIYQYDFCGLVTAFGYEKSTEAWGANVFSSVATGVVSAVGFYAVVPGTEYTISVYTNCNNRSPVSGGLALSQSGTSSIAGFRTVVLDRTVPLEAVGERFSVVLRLNTPGSDYPLALGYACEGYSSLQAYAGESFYSENGKSWTDAQWLNRTANFCIKAYADEPERRAPTDLFVDAARPDDAGDGFSWETARKNLSAAVLAAVDGDRIFVAPGVYGPVDASLPALETLTVVATGGVAATVIDAGFSNSCVITASNGILFEGFVLRNARVEGYVGGGAYGGTFVGCTISNCVASAGGGVAYAYLTNCLVVGNRADYGGGVCNCFLANCTVADNSAVECGGGAYLEEGFFAVNTSFGTNVCAKGYANGNDVYGMDFSTLTNCLVDADARYVDPVHGDYRLSANSPCLDAGRNDLAAGLATDLAGGRRLVGARVDIGCYEYDHVPAGWTDPGVTADDSPATEATKVQAALVAAGFSSETAANVTSSAQYAALTAWAEQRGVPTTALVASPTALISSALWADGLLELEPEDLHLVGLEPSADGWTLRLSLDDYHASRANAALLKAAVGVIGADSPEKPFDASGLTLDVAPREGHVELSVRPPTAAESYFLKATVR